MGQHGATHGMAWGIQILSGRTWCWYTRLSCVITCIWEAQGVQCSLCHRDRLGGDTTREWQGL